MQRKERGCERIGEQVRETKTVGCAPTERRRHGVISDLNKLRSSNLVFQRRFERGLARCPEVVAPGDGGADARGREHECNLSPL